MVDSPFRALLLGLLCCCSLWMGVACQTNASSDTVGNDPTPRLDNPNEEPNPEPTPEPAPEPQEPTPEPNPEPTPEPNPEPTPEPNPEPQPTPMPVAEPEPTPEPQPEPVIGEAEILQQGTSGYLLRGAVLTPEGVLDPGEVLVVGNTIACVAQDCTEETGASDATWIDTRGVISPGLIDAHNHLAYNFLEEWIPNPVEVYGNRYQWSEDPSYEDHVRPYAAHRSSSSHFCPGSRWGEMRSLIHATTTMQGQSFERTCTQGSVRNADHSHHLQHDHMRTTIGSVRDINDEAAQSLLNSFNNPDEPTTRYAVHMAEGYEGNNIENEFESFAGRDTRNNRHSGISLLEGGRAMLIHSVPLSDEQLQEAMDNDAKIVWSPSSNIVLYARTAPIERMMELGMTIGLGPDWTVSGEANMLAELRFAHNYGEESNIDALTPQRLWEMATAGSANAVGLQDYIGLLEEGMTADIAVFARIDGTTPYENVLASRSNHVRLVIIDGEGHYGDANLQEATARNVECEPMDVCGVSKYICVDDPGLDDQYAQMNMAELEQTLVNILEGTGFPDDEQYGRGNELLPLVDCNE